MHYNQPKDPEKAFLIDSATKEQIERHSDQVRRNQIHCHLPPCSDCKVNSDNFRLHDKRKRQFYVIIEQFLEVVIGLLARWKCSGCGKSFTEYPAFALPYKRYTLPTIKFFSQKYAATDEMSCRKLTKETPVGYETKEEEMVERQLDHSTIHRWIGTLGGFETIVRKAQDLILQAYPATTVCRDLLTLTVSERKYRSKQRKERLLGCRRLFTLDRVYELLFSVSIFPNLATQCAFT